MSYDQIFVQMELLLSKDLENCIEFYFNKLNFLQTTAFSNMLMRTAIASSIPLHKNQKDTLQIFQSFMQ